MSKGHTKLQVTSYYDEDGCSCQMIGGLWPVENQVPSRDNEQKEIPGFTAGESLDEKINLFLEAS
ncbi:hypothetical protein DCAR_0726952 [Daucus carota subsp. sativus]|uniref:Uncharacterized protein n=1 Tax=Daucus carota subsp. sativus TaxID=79200 RepID=A0A164SMY2_DAUCS|nr:hypothetical protein DCAR_0726952 [Daucus carota subsp. sativus]